MQEGEWYHVAVTFDTEKKVAVIYVDGREQSRIEDYGEGKPINLGMQNRGKDFMFKIGHSYGEPTDFSRQLDGEICEVRVWNVMRTQQEILLLPDFVLTGSLTKDMATLPRITPDMEMMLMYIYRLLYGRKALR